MSTKGKRIEAIGYGCGFGDGFASSRERKRVLISIEVVGLRVLILRRGWLPRTSFHQVYLREFFKFRDGSKTYRTMVSVFIINELSRLRGRELEQAVNFLIRSCCRTSKWLSGLTAYVSI